MTHLLSEARLRARRHWYLDGLSDIHLGVLMLLMAGEDVLSILSNGTATWYFLAYVGLMLVLLAFASRIQAAVRERVTYPRSGYVRESGRTQRIVVGMVAGIAAVVACLLAVGYERHAGRDPDRWFQWLSAAGGLATVALGVYVAVRHGVLRFLVVGVFALVLGLVVSTEYSSRLAITIWLAGIGCAWLCSGAFTLRNYLRSVPRPARAT